MSKVAVITPKPVKTNMSELFGISVQQLSLTSQNVKRVLVRDVDLEIDVHDYDWVILVGSEPLKYFSAATSITNASGSRVDAKAKKPWSDYEGFLACINPAGMFFKPELKPIFEHAKDRLLSFIDGTYKPPAECDYKIWAEDSSELNNYLNYIIHSDDKVIALDSECSSFYPRRGDILGISISHKERQGIYAGLDAIDSETLVLFQKLIDNPDKHLVLHNAKFDINWFKLHLDANFDKAFAEHRLHDSMIQHYVLDERPGHGLKPLAIKYTDMGNYDSKLDEFKKQYCKENNIKQSEFSYAYIPFDTLSEYACLSRDSQVLLGDGVTWAPIVNLVRDNYTGAVMSMSPEGVIEPKEVTGWYKNTHKSMEWKKIVYANRPKGMVYSKGTYQGPAFTPDHRILTDRGYVEIQDIIPGVHKVAQKDRAMTKDTLEVISGCLLGDGRLESRNMAGAGFEFGQSGPRGDLVDLIAKAFPEARTTIYPAKGNREEVKLVNLPYSHEQTDLFNIVRQNFVGKGGVNKPSITLLEHATIKTLAWWYMGDGNLPEKSKPRIWRRDCPAGEVTSLIEWMHSLGVKASYYSNQFFVIENEEEFMELVAPYVSKGCAYKLRGVDSYGYYTYNLGYSDEPYYAEVQEVWDWEVPTSRRGYATSYCIDVKDNHNFVTKIGVVHNCKDSDATIRLHNKFYPIIERNPRLLELYRDLLMPGVRLLGRMEDRGVPVSIERIRAAQKELHTNIFKAEEELYQCKEVLAFEKAEGTKFNPQSPIQMRKLLFDYGDYTPTGKLTDTGEISCDAEVLQQLAEFGELPGVLLKIRKNTKLLSSFLNKMIDNIDSDGRVRTGFNLATTTSGRLSSSGTINLQQLPRDNPIVKGCITAPKGYRIVALDMSTAEVYIAASLSGDTALQQVFKDMSNPEVDSGDVHSTIAHMVFNLTCKPSEVKQKYPAMRQAAKAITFGISNMVPLVA